MAFSFIEHMVLGYDCPLSEEHLWTLLERTAGQFSDGEEPLRFKLRQRSPVSELAEGASGVVEYWEAEGAQIQRTLVELDASRPGPPQSRLSYRLQLKSGLRMEVKGEARDGELPRVQVHLYHLRPDDFDAIHGLLEALLDPDADISFEPAMATPNVEAALKAGYGAFARHLIDRAMEGRPKTGPKRPSNNELWWDRLLELRQSLPGRGSSTDT